MKWKILSVIALLVTILIVPPRIAVASSDVAFTTTRLTEGPSVIIKVFQSIGFDIAGLIVPFFTEEGDIAGPDHEPTAKWKANTMQYFTPQNYKDDGKHIDWDENENPIFYTSYYGAFLNSDAEHSTHPPPTDCFISKTIQKSSDVPYAPLDFQTARQLDANVGINPVDPNEAGVVDYNLPPLTIAGMNPAEDCKKMDIGQELEKVANDIRVFGSFGTEPVITREQGHETENIFTTVIKWIQGQLVEITDYATETNTRLVVLTEKKKEPYYSIKTHDGGGPEREAGDFSGNSAKSGGWTAFTLREEDKKPEVSSSLQEYKIRVAGFTERAHKATYDLMNIAQVRMQQAACYMVPDTSNTTYDNLQKTTGIGDPNSRDTAKPDVPHFIPIFPECDVIEAKCPIDLIEQGEVTSAGACMLANAGAYTSSNNYLTATEKAALPSGIPPLMKKVLEAAGSTYNVPASVLLGTMLEEGSFTHADVWKWTDDTVKQFSDCTVRDPMPSCEEFAHPSTGAKGPFGFIQNWWDQYIESGGPYKAFEKDPAWKEVLANIPKENITQCNFVDAAFTAARELGEDQSHLYVPGIPLSCPAAGGTITVYQGGDIPSSCSAWSAERTALARLQYGDRVCDLSVERMVNTYKNFSGGRGKTTF